MTSSTYFIRPQSPLVFRSGRPFGAEDAQGGAYGYDFPLPSSVAGALRAAWVDAVGHRVGERDQTMLGLHMRGGLRAVRPGIGAGHDIHLYAPRPANVQYQRDMHGKAVPVSAAPMALAAGEGCGLPHGLQPIVSSSRIKPQRGPTYWSMGALASWLAGSQVVLDGQQSLRELPHDLRPHVAIDSSTLTGADGALFQSDGLDFDIGGADQGLIAWLHSPDAGARTHAAAGRCGRLGADGGSAMFERVQDNALRGLDCPPALKRTLDTLQVGDCLRLLLLTPACYLRNGWYPDGLRPNDPDQPDSPIEGCLAPLLVPPNKEDRARSGLHKDWRIDNPRNWRFRLRAAAVDRWLPLAGSNSRDDAGQAGFMRRPLRRLVPAGAVYWLQILRRGELPLSSLWMQSSCRTDFARDGFGLALPGLVRA